MTNKVIHTPIQTRSKNQNQQKSQGAIPKTPRNSKPSRDNGQKMEEERKRLDEERKKIDEERAELERIMRDKQANDELTAEVNRLRIENEEQRRLVERTQAQHVLHQQGDVESRFVSGLINRLQNFNIDIKMPKFSGEDSTNPREFLSDLEKYFIVKNVPEEQKIWVVHSTLEGRAKIWIDGRRSRINNYTGFKAAFIQEFYSTAIQIREKNRWSQRRYKQSDGNLRTYYLKQVKEAQYFEPKMSDYEINYSIVQQMPYRIKESMIAIDFSKTAVIEAALSQLDAIQEEKDNDQKRRLFASNKDNDSFAKTVGLGNKQNYPNQQGYNVQQQTSNSYQYPNSYQNSASNFANFTFPNVNVPPPSFNNSNNGNRYSQTSQSNNWNSQPSSSSSSQSSSSIRSNFLN